MGNWGSKRLSGTSDVMTEIFGCAVSRIQSLLFLPGVANNGAHPLSEGASTLSISPTQYVEFLPLCYLQNLKIKTLFETTFMPQSFSFLILRISDFYLGIVFFPSFQTQQCLEQEHATQVVWSTRGKEASSVYFTWTAEIMLQLRRCHHSFSMPH